MTILPFHSLCDSAAVGLSWPSYWHWCWLKKLYDSVRRGKSCILNSRLIQLPTSRIGLFLCKHVTSSPRRDLLLLNICLPLYWLSLIMYKPASQSMDQTADYISVYKAVDSNALMSGDRTSPISVILVSSGSRGNKLLFRYPFQRVSENTSSSACKCINSLFL